jgi:hypothetical protein
VNLARIRTTKDACFLSHLEDRSINKYVHKKGRSYINSDVEHNYFMERGEKRKGKQNDRASIILHTIKCEGRGYKDA